MHSHRKGLVTLGDDLSQLRGQAAGLTGKISIRPGHLGRQFASCGLEAVSLVLCPQILLIEARGTGVENGCCPVFQPQPIGVEPSTPQTAHIGHRELPVCLLEGLVILLCK